MTEASEHQPLSNERVEPTAVPQTSNACRSTGMTRVLCCRWLPVACLVLLGVSVVFNAVLYWRWHEYFSNTSPPRERFHSGIVGASDKIVLLDASTTIMPPFTERLIQRIRKARDDEQVRGMILVIDSPGGLVADSHEIYRELKQFSETRPIYVSMKRIAASGGYYIAMGAGPRGTVFVEETTWTGSIGVILPRFNLTKLATNIGVESDSLKTGPLKDTLNPFRNLTDNERAVWDEVLNDSFERFIDVIADNRAELNQDRVRELATGQIYTARQAIENKLVDQVGYLDDVIEAIKDELQLDEARVVEYESTIGVIDLLLGSMQARPSSIEQTIDSVLATGVPCAWYHCSSLPPDLHGTRHE